MKNESGYRKALRAINRYIVFFLLMAFIITCCMLLFLSIMSKTMNLTLDSENIGTAAKLTFANVIFLSALCTVIDGVRRKLAVDRPVKLITDAAKKMMRGDFSVRIPESHTFDPEDRFGEIISCFNKMAEELSGTETLRTDFIANVSHELKTPLSVIHNYGTMLQKPGLDEEKRAEYSKAITESSRRLANLISNILKLNKLENQQIFPEAKTYDLGEQLCQCLLGFEEAWEEKELNIETDIEENVLVKNDGEMLSLVWNNLFSNAVKFTPAGGTVGLTLCTEGSFAVVRVSDTGCGISREVGSHIFDKFYQGDTSHATQGNGLGLALVKRVIDITGSEINIESEVGKGSVFTVKLRRILNESAEKYTV